MAKSIGIGTVAKMFGLTPQALRYYQNMGIVNPKHAEENGYRCYPSRNVIHLFKTKYLQSMGFSLNTILEKNKKGIPFEQWMELLAEHQEALAEQIRRSEMVLNEMVRYGEQIQNMKDQFNAYSIKNSPPMFFLPIYDEADEMSDEQQNIEEIKKWVDLFPFTRYAFLYSKESFFLNLPKDYCGNRGLMIPAELADRFDIHQSDVVKYIPSRRCIRTIVRRIMKSNSSISMLEQAVGYLREQGMEVTDDAIGTWIVSLKEQTNTKYYEVWIPISEANAHDTTIV